MVRKIFNIAAPACVLAAVFAFGQTPVPQEPAQPAPAPQAPVQQEPAQQEFAGEASGQLDTAGLAAGENAVMADEPEAAQPDSAQPGPAQADPAEPDSAQPGPAQTEAAAAPQEEPKRIRIGVMYLESSKGNHQLAADMTGALVTRLDSMGQYEAYPPDAIDRAFAAGNIRKPNNCRDLKCIQSIAKALGLERMVYGTVDMNGAKCGVTLELIDVSHGKPLESVSIEGAAGIPAEYIMQCALDRLHGYESEAEVSRYYGPEVDNLKEFMWLTIAVQGAGIFYSAINYGIGGMGNADGVELVGGAYGKEKYSGIPAMSNQIPVFARPAALANAYTAVSDDAYGVLYNPAGMPFAVSREAALAYQYRFGMDILAASYVNKATRDIGFGQALLLSTDRDNLMTELYFISAAGYKYNRMPIMGPLSAGASIKMMGSTVNSQSPDSPRGQSFGWGLDLGLMWELSETIRYGLNIRDVLSVNRWRNRTTGSQYSEWMPAAMQMGGSYKAGQGTLLVADGQIPLYADQPWVMAGGIEYEFPGGLALRIGLQREIMNEEADWWKITGGGGMKFDTEPVWGKYLYLDIAYEYNTMELFPVLNVSLRAEF